MFGICKDARRSTSPWIKRRLEAVVELPEAVDEAAPAVEARLQLLLFRRQAKGREAAGAQADEAAVRPVLAVVAAAQLRECVQAAVQSFRAWTSSMPCWRPASIRTRNSTCVVRAIRADVLAILCSAPGPRRCFAPW